MCSSYIPILPQETLNKQGRVNTIHLMYSFKYLFIWRQSRSVSCAWVWRAACLFLNHSILYKQENACMHACIDTQCIKQCTYAHIHTCIQTLHACIHRYTCIQTMHLCIDTHMHTNNACMHRYTHMHTNMGTSSICTKLYSCK